MSILRLPIEISRKGFIYKQIKRSDKKFIYAQYNKSGRIVSYEVFLNKLGNLHKAKERWAKLQNKPFNASDYDEFFEVFPGDEEFGKRAWTYPDIKNAMLAFESK